MHRTVLVINPGSTSTKVAIYAEGRAVADRTLAVKSQSGSLVRTVLDEAPARLAQVRQALDEAKWSVEKLEAIAARGGPLAAVPAGTYRVNAAMLDDCRSDRYVMHASRLGAILADEIGRAGRTDRAAGIPAFIVDPVSVDEFDPVARVSGLAECPRLSLLHALNIRSVALRYAQEIGKPYESLNLIVAHLGGGCSIAVHKGGRMVDAVDANGDGPFSVERSGGLRADSLAQLCFTGRFRSASDFVRYATRYGGLMGHLGTSDCMEVEARIEKGDARAKLAYDAMAYQTAKHIAALAAVVNGRVDAVLITGGPARSEYLVSRIAERVAFLGPVRAYPGEREMEALYEGVARVLDGVEKPRVYPTGEREA